MDEFQYRDTIRGRSAALCCFVGAKLEFLRSLYAIPRRGSEELTSVRSNAEFKAILAELLEACSAGSARLLDDIQLEVLASLVHQLFKNADVHTITDEHGDVYGKGVRGVQVREVQLDSQEAFDDFVAGELAVRAYLSKIGLLRGMKGRTAGDPAARTVGWQPASFVEITVFDTGPGLALRWAGRHRGITGYNDLTRDEELEAVRDCFRLHATTQSSANRGDGLEIAVRAMHRLKAFMYLRTGRLSLYQDFSVKEHHGFAPGHRYGVKRPLGEVTGASYSICFPLRT